MHIRVVVILFQWDNILDDEDATTKLFNTGVNLAFIMCNIKFVIEVFPKYSLIAYASNVIILLLSLIHRFIGF